MSEKTDIVEMGEYSTDQQRAAEYIVQLTGIGGGDDPIGFLIASHAVLVERLRAVERPADPRGWHPGDPRCDVCDNGIHEDWIACPYCAVALSPPKDGG